MMKRIFLLLLPLLLVACSDDENFSTSQSDLLTLPADGLRMDTVFCGEGSSTYSFWLYNRNSKALRISDVRLANGSMGFRVNVDGEYLNPAIGQVEVLGNDSLQVFVEFTPQPTGLLEPQEVNDQLVFTLESGAQQALPLKSWAWEAERWDNKHITSDTYVESDRPILVRGIVTIDAGATLTLERTQLYFHENAGVDVKGTLVADQCLFRGDRLDRMFSYLPYDRISGLWRGLRLYTDAVCQFTDTQLRNAETAIQCDEGSQLNMTRSIVHNSEQTGITAVKAQLTLDHCRLSNAEGPLLEVDGGSTKLIYCTLAQYYPFALRDVALRFSEESQLLASHVLLAAYGDLLLDENYVIDWEQDVCEFADGNIVFDRCKMATKEDFLLIDEDNLDYDFHLSETSEIEDAGCY